jgi:hypothetical protein
MNHTDITDASQICHRFNLGEPPTYQRIQRLFEELYLNARLNPDYLFVAERDCDALNDSVRKGSRSRPSGEVLIDDRVALLCNPTTGHYVRVVALPGLEYSGVVVGFFR